MVRLYACHVYIPSFSISGRQRRPRAGAQPHWTQLAGGASPASGLCSECPAPTFLRSALAAGAMQNLSVTTVITKEEVFSLIQDLSQDGNSAMPPAFICCLLWAGPSLLTVPPSSLHLHTVLESQQKGPHNIQSAASVSRKTWSRREAGPVLGGFLLWLTLS